MDGCENDYDDYICLFIQQNQHCYPVVSKAVIFHQSLIFIFLKCQFYNENVRGLPNAKLLRGNEIILLANVNRIQV